MRRPPSLSGLVTGSSVQSEAGDLPSAVTSSGHIGDEILVGGPARRRDELVCPPVGEAGVRVVLAVMDRRSGTIDVDLRQMRYGSAPGFFVRALVNGDLLNLEAQEVSGGVGLDDRSRLIRWRDDRSVGGGEEGEISGGNRVLRSSWRT
jgi:hypothetical protein